MMKDELSDDELLCLINAGSKSAELAFYERYYRHARSLAKALSRIYVNVGVSEDEFTAVAFATLPKLIKCYDAILSSFYNFWLTCAKNAVASYLRKNAYGSESRPYFRSIDEGELSGDRISSKLLNREGDESDRHEMYANDLKGTIINLLEDPKNRFTEDEKTAGYLVLIDGYSNKELMRTTGWDKNHTNYTLHRVKSKLIILLKEYYQD